MSIGHLPDKRRTNRGQKADAICVFARATSNRSLSFGKLTLLDRSSVRFAHCLTQLTLRIKSFALLRFDPSLLKLCVLCSDNVE